MDTLLGIAMGRVGMSYSDFERCTPSEFSRAVEQSDRKEEARLRAGWERTRVQVVSVLNLFSKKRLDPRTAFPLPWDGDKARDERPRGTSSPERMKEIVERLGRKT